MGQQSPGFLERLGLGQSLKRWRRALQSGGLSAAELRAILSEMRSLRGNRLDTLSGGGADGASVPGGEGGLSPSTISGATGPVAPARGAKRCGRAASSTCPRPRRFPAVSRSTTTRRAMT
jgi:hypothetical protein